MTVTNRALVAKADRLARQALRGGVQRQASSALAAALRTTDNLTGARRALETLNDPTVRLAAEQLLAELTTTGPPT